MELPAPGHPITIARNANRVRVVFAGEVIADTTRALTLNEAGYAPVHYIPRADVTMSRLKHTAHTSHCPYKGDASWIEPTLVKMKACMESDDMPPVGMAAMGGPCDFCEYAKARTGLTVNHLKKK